MANKRKLEADNSSLRLWQEAYYREKNRADSYEKSLLRWRKSFDEVDARETESWRQVNELSQKVTGLTNSLARRDKHIATLTQQIKEAKAKRDQRVAYLTAYIEAFDPDNRYDVARLLAEYKKLYNAYTIARQYADTPAGKDELAMRLDSELWDFVQSQCDGNYWVARQSTTGRGFRLHNTSDGGYWRDGGDPVGVGTTAREAVLDLAKQIDNYKEPAD
jgi:DNA repair exonuclease SbcCD ATPase subunit